MTIKPVDLQQNTLDIMILKAASFGPVHGYAVARWIQVVTDAALLVEEGTLYPALHRLEERGFIAADWGASENNRRAKYYTLTVKGRRHLRAAASSWGDLAGAMAKVLGATGEPV
jgi:transcriptional regulator